MIDVAALVVQHHVFHLHNDGAIAVVRRVLQGLVGFLIVVEFHDVQKTVPQVPRQCRQRTARVSCRRTERRRITRGIYLFLAAASCGIAKQRMTVGTRREFGERQCAETSGRFVCFFDGARMEIGSFTIEESI